MTYTMKNVSLEANTMQMRPSTMHFHHQDISNSKLHISICLHVLKQLQNDNQKLLFSCA